MDPCFFVHDKETNHLQFHFRSPNCKEVPHKFQKFPYIPDIFENKKNWQIKQIYIKYNFRFFWKGLTDVTLKKKIQDFDKKLLKKAHIDLIGIYFMLSSTSLLLNFLNKRRNIRLKYTAQFSLTTMLINFWMKIMPALLLYSTWNVFKGPRLFRAG